MGLYMIVICIVCIDFLFLFLFPFFFAASFVCVTSIGGISGRRYLVTGWTPLCHMIQSEGSQRAIDRGGQGVREGGSARGAGFKNNVALFKKKQTEGRPPRLSVGGRDPGQTGSARLSWPDGGGRSGQEVTTQSVFTGSSGARARVRVKFPTRVHRPAPVGRHIYDVHVAVTRYYILWCSHAHFLPPNPNICPPCRDF